MNNDQRKCPICGKPVSNTRSKYCLSIICHKKARSNSNRKWRHQKKFQEDRPKCLFCGKTIGKYKGKYCSSISCQNKAHRNSNLKWQRIHLREYRLKKREEVLILLGSKCSRCGITDKRVLQIDHIHGGGNQELGERGWRGSNMKSYHNHILKTNGEGYQLLCANCNWIKRYEQKEFLQP